MLKLGARYVPLSSIQQARQRLIEEKWMVEVELVDNDRFTVELAVWEDALARTPQQMIPAQSGTYLLSPCFDPPFEIVKEPVIAWALTADGVMAAITNNGINDGGPGNEPILFPTGEVRSPVANWSTYGEYEAEQRAISEGRPVNAPAAANG